MMLASLLINLPKTYGKLVLPVPLIPSKIKIFDVARPAINVAATFRYSKVYGGMLHNF